MTRKFMEASISLPLCLIFVVLPCVITPRWDEMSDISAVNSKSQLPRKLNKG